MRLIKPLQIRVERALVGLMSPSGRVEDFSQPAGEPAFLSPESVSWRIFKNPLALFVGGVAGVLLELAEPRVRSGVWDHSYFRTRPLERLQRTALAAMLSVYGARSRAEAMIDRVRTLHSGVAGRTAAGQAYRADDPDLLAWVHATASFGFIEAYQRYVHPLTQADHDRFYLEGIPVAERFGAAAVPRSRAEMRRLLDDMSSCIEPSEALVEFVRIVRNDPLLPGLLRHVQGQLVDAAMTLLPQPILDRTGLQPTRPVVGIRHKFVTVAGTLADRLVLDSGPPAQACRRVGRPVALLYEPPGSAVVRSSLFD